MRVHQSGPGGADSPSAAQETFGNPHDSNSTRHRQPARCALHGLNLVHRFPPRCPLALANPLATLGQLQDAAWRVLGRGVGDPEVPDALALLPQFDICGSCIDRLARHPTVRQLRAGTAVAA